jgi:hypothetical protein
VEVHGDADPQPAHRTTGLDRGELLGGGAPARDQRRGGQLELAQRAGELLGQAPERGASEPALALGPGAAGGLDLVAPRAQLGQRPVLSDQRPQPRDLCSPFQPLTSGWTFLAPGSAGLLARACAPRPG